MVNEKIMNGRKLEVEGRSEEDDNSNIDRYFVK